VSSKILRHFEGFLEASIGSTSSGAEDLVFVNIRGPCERRDLEDIDRFLITLRNVPQREGARVQRF